MPNQLQMLQTVVYVCLCPLSAYTSLPMPVPCQANLQNHTQVAPPPLCVPRPHRLQPSCESQPDRAFSAPDHSYAPEPTKNHRTRCPRHEQPSARRTRPKPADAKLRRQHHALGTPIIQRIRCAAAMEL